MRRLIVNADDFGRSAPVNHAVIAAHRHGILTSASLMVNEPGLEEAVRLARENPELGVGLHLTLVCGRPALPRHLIPGLVNAGGEFGSCPVIAGFRYFACRRLREQLRAEVTAQFERFHSTGLPLDHVNGHLHLHLHPAIFPILLENAQRWGIRRMRWTNDPFWLNARLAKGRWCYRLAHAALFQGLCRRARAALQQHRIRHTQTVFGLLQDSRVDEPFLLRLLPALPAGDSELYSHPSLHQPQHEYDALVSPRVRDLLRQLGVERIRYRDL